MPSIEELKEAVEAWLVDRELDRDTVFDSREEWKARNERYLADAELVLVFEGGLYSVMNGHHQDSIELYDEFEQLVRGLGYFFELGHAWSMGFYPRPVSAYMKLADSSAKI
jgi:hypothetical protein